MPGRKVTLREIEYFRPQIDKKYIKSVFFGGGTPSLMDPDIVRQIISKLSMIGSD
jgi:oxygen-independent coproporphyrinogen-3 oxidase